MVLWAEVQSLDIVIPEVLAPSVFMTQIYRVFHRNIYVFSQILGGLPHRQTEQDEREKSKGQRVKGMV